VPPKAIGCNISDMACQWIDSTGPIGTQPICRDRAEAGCDFDEMFFGEAVGFRGE